MKPTENIEKFIKNTYADNLPAATSAKLDQRVLGNAQDTLEKSKTTQSAGTRPNIWRIIMKRRITKLAAAAVIIIAVLIGINQFGGSIDGASVAWADVAERFRSVPFFSTVIYMKEDALSEPKQIELWMGQACQSRMRIGSQVVFGQGGKVTKAFDVKSRREAEPESTAEALLGRLGGMGEFSLDTVIRSISGGKLVDVTPEVNSDAVISKDLVVFDLKSKISPEWLRIWALRSSKLPVRVRMWDPRDGGCVDAIMNYSRQQADEFFDPDSYFQELQGGGKSKTNLAYALLKDPGGQLIMPEDIFEQNDGYHMPVLEQIGITEKGAVWVIAGKSKNRKSDGYSFFGFRQLKDDLGREYKMRDAIHRTAEDRSLEIFVPLDYPFDKRLPNTITLQCSVDYIPRDEPKETIGTVEVNEWQKNAPWPAGLTRQTENDVLLTAAYGFCKHKDFDKLHKVVQIISGSADSETFSYKLDQLRLESLMQKKQFNEASALAEQLWSPEMEIYKHPKHSQPNPHPLLKYILAVAANGEIDRAGELFNELEQTEPDLSRFNKRTRERMQKEIPKERTQYITNILYDFFGQANLSLAQVNQIFGFDVSQNGETKWGVPEKYRTHR